MLAITVNDGGTFATDYTRFYAYRFDHFRRNGGDSVTGMGDCSSERPVRLPAMPAESFTAAGVAKLRRTLDTLGRPRTAAEVRSITAQMFPLPAAVAAGRDGRVISVLTELDEACVKGLIPVTGAGHASLPLMLAGPNCGA